VTGKLVEPAAGLESLIESIVDKILRQRRMRPMPPQAVMSQQQFATSNGISLSTVQKEIREGRLEALKIGKRTGITTEAGDRWRASRPRIKPLRSHDNGASRTNA
jgi:hypothetical protein